MNLSPMAEVPLDLRRACEAAVVLTHTVVVEDCYSGIELSPQTYSSTCISGMARDYACMILDIAIAIFKVWCLLFAFGLAGLPFSLGLFGTYRFHILMAPMSGLLGMSVVLLAIYHILNLTFQTSALLAAMLLAGLACASFVIRRPERRDLRSALISLVIIAIVGAACALVVDTASIVNRDLAVPLLHGTDQAPNGSSRTSHRTGR
jgi:hypothetical protein